MTNHRSFIQADAVLNCWHKEMMLKKTQQTNQKASKKPKPVKPVHYNVSLYNSVGLSASKLGMRYLKESDPEGRQPC